MPRCGIHRNLDPQTRDYLHMKLSLLGRYAVRAVNDHGHDGQEGRPGKYSDYWRARKNSRYRKSEIYSDLNGETTIQIKTMHKRIYLAVVLLSVLSPLLGGCQTL